MPTSPRDQEDMPGFPGGVSDAEMWKRAEAAVAHVNQAPETLEREKDDQIMPLRTMSEMVERVASEIEHLRKALTDIANQKTTDDYYEEYGEEFVGDYEAGYDAIIRIARDALSRQSELVSPAQSPPHVIVEEGQS